MFPPPLKARSWLGDAPPSFQEAHSRGKAPGVLTQGKNYMRRKIYVSYNTPLFYASSLLSGSNRRPAAYKAAALAI